MCRRPAGASVFVVSDYYNSGFRWDPDNRLRQSSFEVVNASVDWNVPKNGWSVRLGDSNLTGTHYCAYAAEQMVLNSCAPAPPRTYGMTLSANF